MTPTEFLSLQDLIIFQDSDGSYRLFEKYTIRRGEKYGFDVTSTVSDKELSFCSLKNATAWCIFDKRDRFYETRRILELDAKLGSIDIDIQVHQKMFSRAKTADEQLIFVAKLHEDRIKKQRMTVELESYTTDSKAWQTKRFDRKPV